MPSLGPNGEETAIAKRKVGRPFKGEVEEFTKEPHVPERRSILRGFKKFYAKKEFDDIMLIRGKNMGGSNGMNIGENNSERRQYLKEIYEGLEALDLQNVQRYMDICRNT
jgi:hypothetical protein